MMNGFWWRAVLLLVVAIALLLLAGYLVGTVKGGH